MADLEPTGALKAIIEDHKAKVAAVESSKDLIAQALAAVAPQVTPALPPIDPGSYVAVPNPPPAPVKPAMKSMEGWIYGLVVALGGYLAESGKASGNQWMTLIGGAVATVAAVFFGQQRTSLKKESL